MEELAWVFYPTVDWLRTFRGGLRGSDWVVCVVDIDHVDLSAQVLEENGCVVSRTEPEGIITPDYCLRIPRTACLWTIPDP
jgi:hypothetical protein